MHMAMPASLPQPGSMRPSLLAAQPRARETRLALGGVASFFAGIIAFAETIPAFVILGVTILLEVAATTCMKLAATRSALWLVGTYVGYGMCFSIFPLALRRLPLSIAYSTWSGVGTVASVMIGVACFGEKITLLKVFWIGLIVAGVVGLAG